MPDQLTVVVTTTFYKNVEELRFGLACETIRRAVAAGYPVVIVDGSPVPEVAEAFRKLGALVFQELYRGIGPSRRQAFYHAVRHLRENSEPEGVVFWTEPEKDDIIRSIPLIVQPLAHGSVISIPRRSEASWKTYPEFQVVSEKAANAAYEKRTGRFGFDPMFGPVAFRISPDVEQLLIFSNPADYGLPDTYVQHYVPVMVAVDRVASVKVDFVYPPEQRAAEEAADNKEIREKRKRQLETLSLAYEILGKMFR